MAVTEAETIEAVDEALAFMTADLYAAKVTGNGIRAEVVLGFIDKTLDRRLVLMGQT